MVRISKERKLVNAQLGRNRNMVIPAGEQYRVPNHSGDHSAGTTGTPVNDRDIANKAYVDAQFPVTHASTTGQTADDHHNELHTIASHSDTSATGAELDTLTDDSMADTLHRHSELSASDGTPNSAMGVDASGNIYLGGSSPLTHVHSYIDGVENVFRVEAGSGNISSFELASNGSGASVQRWQFSNRGSGSSNRLELYYYNGSSWSPSRMTFDATTGYVGFGTIPGDFPVTIGANLNNTSSFTPELGSRGILSHGAGTDQGEFWAHRDDATITSGNELGTFYFSGADPDDSYIGAKITAEASENWTTGSSPADMVSFTTPSGSNAPVERERLHDSGLRTYTGEGSGVPFGHMYDNSTIAVTISAANTPTEVGDTWTTGLVQDMTFGASHYLVATTAGKYKIDWSMSVAQNTPSAAIQMEGGIMINGSAITGAGRSHRTVANSTDIGAFSSTAILDLAANDQISLYVENQTNTTNLDVEHANVSAVMIGGT